MVIELAAVRLIAPWFGTSLVVWSNVIAVVLLGLSIGYLLGARLSRGTRPVTHLLRLLALGALATAWTPLLAQPVATWFVPEGLTLDRALEVFRWGSLATSLCLFLLPAAILGGIGPLVTELVVRSTGLHAGDAGGRVLFSSTLGSLVGVFGTSYWAVPTLGMRWTFFGAALLLGLAVTLVLWSRRRGSGSTLVLLALALGGGLLPVEAVRAQPGFTTLELGESAYQRVRVVEEEGAGRRLLQVNESSNSFQSVWQPALGLLDGDYYYNDFVLPAWWTFAEQSMAGTSTARRPWRVLCVGMGAGTAKRVLAGALPTSYALAFEGIELDPLVVQMARTWCDLEQGSDDLLISGLDGRAATRFLAAGFDQILVDAYANQIEIPPHLTTIEFFRELRGKLKPNGWLQINVGGDGPEAPLVQALAGTLSRALDTPALISQVPGTRNLIVTARIGGAPPVPNDVAWNPAALPGEIRELLVGRDVRGQWAWIGPTSPVDLVLTDDRAPVELLEIRSLEARAAHGVSPRSDL